MRHRVTRWNNRFRILLKNMNILAQVDTHRYTKMADTLSAKFTYQNRIWALLGPFFVLVSKGFSLVGRPTETDKVLKISL